MRRSWLIIVLPGLAALTGCYAYVPFAETTPPVGQVLKLSISDRGRVELGERVGPGVAQLEGRVVSVDGDQLTLNVYRVEFISGESSQWSGESMRLNRDFVQRFSARRLSKSRTWLVAGVAVVAVTAFVASHGLFGFFTGEREDPTPPPPTSLRLRLISPF